jgi:thiol-disulfide isomerase/thioredoxin
MKRLAICVALPFALCLSLFAQTSGKPDAASQETGRQSAPGFVLKDLHGKTARLTDYKGKLVLVNFWATWCAPCQMEMPELVKLQAKYAERGLQIVGLTYEPEGRALVSRVSQKFKINYPLLFGNENLSKQYGVLEVLPVTVIVGRDGKIIDRVSGMIKPEEFEQKIVPLL